MADRVSTTNRTRWIPRLRAVGASYWFVPTLMAGAAIAASYATLWLDRSMSGSALGWTYSGDAAGARAVLNTVGSSMITVAGVVFSITIVALSLASQQFGPMLLRNFMSDRSNQLVLGTFVATFLYCLMIMRAVIAGGGGRLVPHLSVTVAIALAVASLGVLIFFIHHIAQSIRIEGVLSRVGEQLERAAARMYPSDIGAPGTAALDDEHGLGAACRTIVARKDGYLEEIGEGQLMELACEHDLVIEVIARPHDFVVSGTPIVRVYPEASCSDETASALAGTLVVGSDRAPRTDVRHGLDQLVQLCLRALSPNLNDPVTAKAAIDRMIALLACVARTRVPSARRYDAAGHLRVIANRPSFEELLEQALDPVRRSSGRNADVVVHALGGIEKLASTTSEHTHRRALAALVTRLDRTARTDGLPTDFGAIDRALRRVAALLSEDEDTGVRARPVATAR